MLRYVTFMLRNASFLYIIEKGQGKEPGPATRARPFLIIKRQVIDMLNSYKEKMFDYGLKLFDDMQYWKKEESKGPIDNYNEAVSAYGHFFNMCEWMGCSPQFLLFLWSKRKKPCTD